MNHTEVTTVTPARGAVARITEYFEQAGITVNGAQAWDPQIDDPGVLAEILQRGSLGLGETYMDGRWTCEDVAEFARRLIRWRNRHSHDWRLLLPHLALNARSALSNLQTVLRATQVIDAHYDLPLPLFERMLGSTMAYSCAYWPRAGSLDEAQRHKLDLICRKLELRPGERVLDLGCGFGSFSRHAAENYGCEIVAVTLSRSQAEFAQRNCAGLPVEIHICDYRDIERYRKGKPFDKIANIAMFEAIGRKNFREFMEIIDRLLKDDGLWLLHTISSDRLAMDPWLHRYIFPNGELPSLESLDRAMRDLFQVEDLQNLGLDYPPTLVAWRANFTANWESIRQVDPARFNDRFFRMWTYYLDSCRGSFLANNTWLWHLLMTKGRLARPYQAVR